jgi:alpha-beta hydrolase superfamily lysophospholipase
MAEAFRVGFRRIAPRVRVNAPSAMRWSLGALDPAAQVLSGTFVASDEALVPYRLWQAEKPRALVLLLHGAFDYSGAFDEIGPKLRERGLTAFAYDQRGFGATASRGHWTGRKRMVKDAVEAVLLLRQRFGHGLAVFLIGESMGAAVAVHVAASARNLDLAGLVLVAPGAIAGTFRRMFGRFVARLLGRFAPESEIQLERRNGSELTATSAIRLWSDPLVLRGVRPKMAFGLLELAANAVDTAHKVSVPALTMVGSRDDVLRTACITRLHLSLKGEKAWESFADGPHLLLHWHEGDRVLARALAFIDDHLAPAGACPLVAEPALPQ